MRILLITIVLMITPAGVNAQLLSDDFKHRYCAKISDFSRHLMTIRLSEVKLADAVSDLKQDYKSAPDTVLADLRIYLELSIIEAAYLDYEIDPNKTHAAILDDFENRVFAYCPGMMEAFVKGYNPK